MELYLAQAIVQTQLEFLLEHIRGTQPFRLGLIITQEYLQDLIIQEYHLEITVEVHRGLLEPITEVLTEALKKLLQVIHSVEPIRQVDQEHNRLVVHDQVAVVDQGRIRHLVLDEVHQAQLDQVAEDLRESLAPLEDQINRF